MSETPSDPSPHDAADQAAPEPQPEPEPQPQPLPWLNPRRDRRMTRISGFLRRRRWLILGSVLPIVALALVYVGLATPIYLAQAQLVIDNPGVTQNSANAALGAFQPAESVGNETRAAEIASTEIAGMAVDQLNLAANPRFNPNLPRRGAGGVLGTIRHAARSALDWIADLFGNAIEPPPPVGASPSERAAALHDQLVNAFLAGLQVVPEGIAPVIDVRYLSPSPEFAMRAANVTAQL